MKDYKSIYSFDVMENIKEGKAVFVLDREAKECVEAIYMSLAEWVDVLSCKNSNRFAFWVEEEIEEEVKE